MSQKVAPLLSKLAQQFLVLFENAISRRLELVVRSVTNTGTGGCLFAVEQKIPQFLALGRWQSFDLLDQFGDAHALKVGLAGTSATGLSRPRKAVVPGGNRTYLPRLMPKSIARSKTRKAVAKRFKITGTGKVLRQHASRRHLLSSKSGKTKRQMAKSALVDKTDVARIKMNMPFA